MNSKSRKTATAKNPTARVSLKDSVKIFNVIRNKPVEKSKGFLDDLINQKRSIGGRYYTNATKEILRLIEEAEKNAESIGLDIRKLFIKEAVTNQAFRFRLPKSRWSHRGRRAKICQLSITLEER